MLTKTDVKAELHRFGGSGKLIVGRAEDFDPAENDLSGKVRLIYLDPPFGSGGSYEFKDKTAVRAYSDRQSADEYLAMMRTVLEKCRELLSDTGSIYVHIDYRMSGRIRSLMDEIFGEDNLMNEIIWSYPQIWGSFSWERLMHFA